MTDHEFKLQLAEVIGTWVAAMSVVIGGLFGIYQYLEHKAAVRVDRSMAFVERYHGNSMLVEARLKITEAISERTSEFNKVLQDQSLSPQELSDRYSTEVMKLIAEKQLNGALEQLFTFYEQILLCRDLELCEETVAEQFFDTDAQGFVNTFYPYICHIRNEWHNPEQFNKITSFYSANLTC